MNDFSGIPPSESWLLTSATVSAIVSLVVSFLFKWAELFKSAEISYKFEQKKKIKTAIGAHIGRILLEAERLDKRLTNLSGNHNRGWLSFTEEASASGPYMKSTVLRFLTFFEAVCAVQHKAIVLDIRYADEEDYEFLNYIAAFRWVVSNIETLFHGMDHTREFEIDHFFSDSIRDICLRFSLVKKRDPDEDDIKKFFDDPRNQTLIDFFKDMSPSDGRPRWDRIVALNILLAGFQEAFGHRRHSKTVGSLCEMASRTNKIQVIRNLKKGLIMHDLHNSKTGQKLSNAFDQAYRARTGSVLET